MASRTGKAKRIMLSTLTPAAYNPRVMPPEHMRRLQASIREHTHALEGWRTSDGYRMVTTITANRNGRRTVGGHQRVEALAALGQDWIHADDVTWVDLVPDSAAEKALNVALNNREMQGEWDAAALGAVLADIETEAGDLYDALELDLLEPDLAADPATERDASDGATDPDDVPPPPDEAQSRPGEVYALGAHRVLCGNAADAGAVDRLLDGRAMDLLFTDPPYGVSYADKNAFLNAGDRGNRVQAEIRNDHLGVDEVARLWRSVWSVWAPRMADPSAYYICTASANGLLVAMAGALDAAGMPYRHMLVWAKSEHVLGRADYNYRHEILLYGWPKRRAFAGNGPQRTTVWDYPRPRANTVHPTMKPVPLIENALLNSTTRGQTVGDPFLGSGSTLIAAERRGRIAVGVEIDPAYCDVIRRRWAEFVHGPDCDWPALAPAT